MPPCVPGSDLVLLASSLSIALASELSADDANILAGFFSAVGDNLAILAAKKQLCEERKQPPGSV